MQGPRASPRSSAPSSTWPTRTARERIQRPGQARRHRRRGRRRQEGLLPPDRCWPRTTRATGTSSSCRSRAFLEGYYRKPKVDWELLADHSRGRHRHHRLPRRPRAPEPARRPLRRGAEQGRPAPGDLRARQPLRRAAGPRHPRAAPHQPAARRDRQAHRRAAARHQRQPLHHARATPRPTTPCCACRPARSSARPTTSASSSRATATTCKSAAEMRHLFREVEVGLRQHALDRRAGRTSRSSSASRSCPRFPLPEGFADDGDYLRHLTFEGARAAVGRRRCPTRSSSGSPTSSRSSTTWGSRPTSSSSGTSSATPASTASGSARAAARRPAARSPTACASPTSTRSVRPAVRALPQPEPDLDARHRHGLRLPLPRRDDPLRGRDVRPRPRRPDRHLLAPSRPGPRCSDAARVLGYAVRPVGDKVAKAMPPLVMGRDTPLYACLEKHEKYEDGYKMAAELRPMYDDRPRRQAGRRRGQGPRGHAPPGRHPRRRRGHHRRDPLTEYLPIQRKPGPNQDPEEAPVVTQYEMGGVEELGLLKMDFLGLRNLDVITDALAMIKEFRGVDVDIDDRPARRRQDPRPAPPGRLDRRVPARGRADAVAHALARARRRFEDVAALVALYRPGPDGGEHAQRLRRPQERPEAGRVLPPRRRGAARRHLRA